MGLIVFFLGFTGFWRVALGFSGFQQIVMSFRGVWNGFDHFPWISVTFQWV